MKGLNSLPWQRKQEVTSLLLFGAPHERRQQSFFTFPFQIEQGHFCQGVVFFLTPLEHPHQSIEKIGNIVDKAMAHSGAASLRPQLPHLVAIPEGPVLELQHQEAILLQVYHF
jgi:hypothetical protein